MRYLNDTRSGKWDSEGGSYVPSKPDPHCAAYDAIRRMGYGNDVLTSGTKHALFIPWDKTKGEVDEAVVTTADKARALLATGDVTGAKDVLKGVLATRLEPGKTLPDLDRLLEEHIWIDSKLVDS